MASRRKSKGTKIGTLALAAGACLGGTYAVLRRRGSSSPGEDRVPAGATQPEAWPPPDGEALNEPPHPPPPGAVMPDTSEDPFVEKEVNAAEAQAGSIGGTVDQLADEEPVAANDPPMRPVLEGSGDDEETFEERSESGGPDREKPL